MDFITAPLITFIVFAFIYGVFELMVRRGERMAIIEKMGDKLEPSMLQGKLNICGGMKFSFGTLKAGCLLIGVGLGLLVGFMICACTFPTFTSNVESTWEIRQLISLVNGASVLLFGGVGLIVAFLVEMKIGKKKD